MSNAPSEAPALTSVRVIDPVTRKGVYLLPGWRQAVSRSKGKTFYFCGVTKETRWSLAGITDELRAPEDLTPEEEAALVAPAPPAASVLAPAAPPPAAPLSSDAASPVAALMASTPVPSPKAAVAEETAAVTATVLLQERASSRAVVVDTPAPSPVLGAAAFSAPSAPVPAATTEAAPSSPARLSSSLRIPHLASTAPSAASASRSARPTTSNSSRLSAGGPRPSTTRLKLSHPLGGLAAGSVVPPAAATSSAAPSVPAVIALRGERTASVRLNVTSRVPTIISAAAVPPVADEARKAAAAASYASWLVTKALEAKAAAAKRTEERRALLELLASDEMARAQNARGGGGGARRYTSPRRSALGGGVVAGGSSVLFDSSMILGGGSSILEGAPRNTNPYLRYTGEQGVVQQAPSPKLDIGAPASVVLQHFLQQADKAQEQAFAARRYADSATAAAATAASVVGFGVSPSEGVSRVSPAAVSVPIDAFALRSESVAFPPAPPLSASGLLPVSTGGALPPSAGGGFTAMGGPSVLQMHGVDPWRAAREEALYRAPNSSELLVGALQGQPLPPGMELRLSTHAPFAPQASIATSGGVRVGGSRASPSRSPAARRASGAPTAQRPLWDDHFTSAGLLSGGGPSTSLPLSDDEIAAIVAAQIAARNASGVVTRSVSPGMSTMRPPSSAVRIPHASDAAIAAAAAAAAGETPSGRRPEHVIAFDRLSLRASLMNTVGEALTRTLLNEAGATDPVAKQFAQTLGNGGASQLVPRLGDSRERARSAVGKARRSSYGTLKGEARPSTRGSSRPGTKRSNRVSPHATDGDDAFFNPSTSMLDANGASLRGGWLGPNGVAIPAASREQAMAALRSLAPSSNDAILLVSSGRPAFPGQGLAALNGADPVGVPPPQTLAGFRSDVISMTATFAAAGQRNAYKASLGTSGAFDASHAALGGTIPGVAQAAGSPVMPVRYTAGALASAGLANATATSMRGFTTTPTASFRASSEQDQFVATSLSLEAVGEGILARAMAAANAAAEKSIASALAGTTAVEVQEGVAAPLSPHTQRGHLLEASPLSSTAAPSPPSISPLRLPDDTPAPKVPSPTAASVVAPMLTAPAPAEPAPEASLPSPVAAIAAPPAAVAPRPPELAVASSGESAAAEDFTGISERVVKPASATAKASRNITIKTAAASALQVASGVSWDSAMPPPAPSAVVLPVPSRKEPPLPPRPELPVAFLTRAASDLVAMLGYDAATAGPSKASIARVHRCVLDEFATAHAPVMLQTLDSAWERFGATPEKLWDACAKRFGDTADPYRARADAGIATLATLHTAAAAYSAECSAWEAGLAHEFSKERAGGKGTVDAADAARERGLTIYASSSYAEPSPSAIFISPSGELTTASSPQALGVALTPSSPSTRPIAPLDAALQALVSFTTAEWRALGLVRKASTALGVVYGTLCVLMGTDAPTWRSALAAVSDVHLPAKLAALTAQGAALAAHVAACGRAKIPPSAEAVAPHHSVAFPSLPPLTLRRIQLAAKLLCKRPDVRAEVGDLQLYSRPSSREGGGDTSASPTSASGSGGGASSGASSMSRLGPIPALAALLEWQLALVLAVAEGLTSTATPPVRVTLLGLASLAGDDSRPASQETRKGALPPLATSPMAPSGGGGGGGGVGLSPAPSPPLHVSTASPALSPSPASSKARRHQ